MDVQIKNKIQSLLRILASPFRKKYVKKKFS